MLLLLEVLRQVAALDRILAIFCCICFTADSPINRIAEFPMRYLMDLHFEQALVTPKIANGLLRHTTIQQAGSPLRNAVY